ncbi:MAG TPA: YbhB/YbcL family Raf kinase inhibitor-like protein [Rhizomicrobium sp.]|nr:YbhB/YbcL family Raf kinase inhibitor-like protein [Rhizomicrobium sp.]
MRRLATGATVLLFASCTAAGAMELASGDIAPGAKIATAQIYPRCGGRNISPALSWSGAPAAAKSLLLTMIDTDVKPAEWSHWIIVDLPPATTMLARGTARLPAGAKAIASNFGDASYDGPCPPTGTGVHHYRFTLWAMPTARTEIAGNAKASEVADKLARTAIASASLIGWVER